MNRKKGLCSFLTFLMLMCWASIVSAGPSLCCEVSSSNIAVDMFLKLWPLFLILLICALILRIMKMIDKKKEKKEDKE